MTVTSLFLPSPLYYRSHITVKKFAERPLGSDQGTRGRSGPPGNQKLLLDSIDAWLLVQSTLVNARKKRLLPVVRERQALADGVARYLTQLGLERRSKQIDLAARLAAL